MTRDRSLDLGKGLAILFVYLGHSILYNPIDMISMYDWCARLNQFITSFNMPMFFLISGYLFSKTNKSTGELYKGKTFRILIPYLFTMLIVICSKLVLPSSMSYNSSVLEGGISLIINALCYGGDRWFAYVLFMIFLLVIPFRKVLKNKWVALGVIAVSMLIYFLDFMPSIFKLDDVFHFTTFFIVGMCLNEKYVNIKAMSQKYWWLIYGFFILANIVFVGQLCHYKIVYRFILPFSGSLAVMTLAFQLEKLLDRSKAVQYVEYIGKYSLQFYLFTFPYPIIRTILVSKMGMTNPYEIFFLVFVLQLLTVTPIVEITRRIKWLKIPCGY